MSAVAEAVASSEAVLPATGIPTPCPLLRADRYVDDAYTMLVVLSRLRDVPLAEALYPGMLEDLEAVLGEYVVPTEEDFPALAHRLDEALALALELLPSRVPHRQLRMQQSAVGRIIGQPLPEEFTPALGVLRRLAVILQNCMDLIEHGGLDADGDPRPELKGPLLPQQIRLGAR
ncbi:hypothetical protein POF50_003310 [Streptomyces sp. SL13]|uniref:Uncharacterized protein n=1 Tax=Streptantibioticus silvisoli TaxID=2705255 RepID=A0AA90KF09_9ACTN|nr:hypothetical protein [Streptantibioticus silvisoli]MDI5968384.1 hypothetical protein [Streptantibioticus silvisoli]